MKRHTDDSQTTDQGALAEDAKVLLAATTDATEEKIVAARARLAEALNLGRATWSRLQDRAVQGAKATDQAIRSHPYPAIGIAFGVGAILGMIAARRK